MIKKSFINIKILKTWTLQKNYKSVKNGTVWFYNAAICPKDADRMANSVDPGQTAPVGQSDL